MHPSAVGLSRYSPSGLFRVSAVGLLLAGAIVGCGGAWIYAALGRWIPFIYINVLICIAFGLLLGRLGALAVRAGHCRNRLLATVFALPLGLAPVAASHYFNYRHTLSEVAEEFQDVPADEIAAQLPFERFLEMRQQTGWKVSRHGSGGSAMTGAFVLVVWGIEVLVVLGGVLFLVWGAAGAAYCERCNAWCGDRTLALHARGADAAEAVFRSGDVAGFAALPPPDDLDRPSALHLVLATCASCKATGFLSVSEVSVLGVGKKRKEKKTELASLLSLRSDQRERLETFAGAAAAPEEAASSD